MPQQPDYRRRRIILAASAAALLIAGVRDHAPMIGTVSVSIDDHLAPQVDADWAPPVAAAIAGVGRVAALIAAVTAR